MDVDHIRFVTDSSYAFINHLESNQAFIFFRSLVFDESIAHSFPVIRIDTNAFRESVVQSIFVSRNIEVFSSWCFSHCVSLRSIAFENVSRLKHIEQWAFFDCSCLISMFIPRNLKIIGAKCFLSCHALSSISFENDCQLKRIKSDAFSYCSLRSIVIPQHVQFINGSAFIGLNEISISIEDGNVSFVISKNFILSFDRTKLIRYFGFDKSVVIPHNIEVLCSSCFSDHFSLSHISFENDSKLKRIESKAFTMTNIDSIVLPTHILFIAGNAFDPSCDIALSNPDCHQEFDEWNLCRHSDSTVNFERSFR